MALQHNDYSNYFLAAVFCFLLSVGDYRKIRGVNLGQGTSHIVRDSERFEITEFEIARVLHYCKTVKKSQGNGFQFDIAGVCYCIFIWIGRGMGARYWTG